MRKIFCWFGLHSYKRKDHIIHDFEKALYVCTVCGKLKIRRVW